jgi:hypothetical protein
MSLSSLTILRLRHSKILNPSNAIEYRSIRGVQSRMKAPLSYIVIAAAVAVASWTMFEALSSMVAG